VVERGAEGGDMSKLGDDLIRSLKEAVAHATEDGPGRAHSSGSMRSVDGAADEADQLKATGPTTQSGRVSPSKTM